MKRRIHRLSAVLVCVFAGTVFGFSFWNEVKAQTGSKSLRDVGLLLGLRRKVAVPNREEAAWGQYRTIWISRTDGLIHVDEVPNLLVPRQEGFWRVGSNVSEYASLWHRRAEFIWRAPLGRPIRLHELTAEETNDSYHREYRHGYEEGRTIVFISEDYIGVSHWFFDADTDTHAMSQSALSAFSDSAMYVFDDSEFKHPLDIYNDVASFAGRDSLPGKVRRKELADWKDFPEMKLSGCESISGAGQPWVVVRKRGQWMLTLTGVWNHGECYDYDSPDVKTSVHAPVSLVGFDELPLPWSGVKKLFPDATDSFGSPTSDLLVVLTRGELFVCEQAGRGFRKPVARFPLHEGEKAVMAQWALGESVIHWNHHFEAAKEGPVVPSGLPTN